MRESAYLRFQTVASCVGLVYISVLSAGFFHNVSVVKASMRVPAHTATPSGPNVAPSQDRKMVIVELVTSGECPECQVAEQTLAHLDRDQPVQDADIIVLSEKVKPHDPSEPSGYLSPIDPTRRQENYQSLGDSSQPAPVFLVDGAIQDAHADVSEIERSIASSPANQVPLRLTSVRLHDDTVTFSLESGPPTSGYVNVYVALLDPLVTTKLVDEHGGERTQTRAGVVEAFGRVGSSFRTKALGERPFNFQTHSSSLTGKRLVVFVQTKHIGLVLGSTSCVLEQSASATAEGAPASALSTPCPNR
jgi:hypothetical protein